MRFKILAALPLVALSLSVPAAAAPPIPRGPEIRVSTGTSVYHFNPSVAVFPDGGFVVVWTASSGPRARFFDSQGKPASGERSLSGVAGFVNQAVADRDGSFLVAWTAITAARPWPNVYVRRFDRNGTPKGNVIRANAPSPYNRYDAVIAVGLDGRFAVAWKAAVPLGGPDEGSYTDAVGRIFKAGGAPLTPEITLLQGDGPSLAGDDSIDAFPSSLALAPDGTLTALVQDREVNCLQSYLERVPAAGGPGTLRGLGSPLCGPDSPGASLAMGLDGSLVAAWSDFGIQAQRFAPGGTPRGQDFWVSDRVNDQADAAVALQAGGSFVIVWTELGGRDGDRSGVFGRAYAQNGTPRSGEFLINTTTSGDQYAPAIAAARRGPVVVVWSQQLVENGRSDIFARVLSANP